MRKIVNVLIIVLVAAAVINGTPESADTVMTASAQTEEVVIEEQELWCEIYGRYDINKILTAGQSPVETVNISAAREKENITDAPTWVNIETFSDGKNYAVGYGKSADRNTALRKAEANARNIMAANYRSATGSDTVTLKGSSRIDTYYTANGGVYVLMACNQDGVVIG